MTVYEMAKKYYPRLWSAERIEALYKADKLTEDEYKSIVEVGNNDG
ncbi:MAG: XkdX family protein [Clostridia bacterium]|nr:XkdX family protein [Clostridia bacterium]MBQ8765971.1 XkdX family protein [Clostridia bacterium]